MKDMILKNFNTLCNNVKEKYDVSFGVNEIEDLLLIVLNYIKKNKNYKKEFTTCFIERIKRNYNFPLEVVIFCMRELQWPEIKEAAINEINKTNDCRIISRMNDILKVYQKDWGDSDMYQYYSEKNNLN